MAKKGFQHLNTGELEEIKVLAAAGLSHRAISRKIGRDHKTIAAACRRPGMAPQIKQVKVALADRFESIAVRMLTAISKKDIMALDGYKKTLSAAIAADKMRLLSGQSTENILAIHLIVEAIEREGMSRKPGEKAVPPTAS